MRLEVYALLFATFTGEDNPLYFLYKLPIESPSVEGGNFVFNKAS